MADIGDSYTISTTVTVAGTPTDPTSITLTVTDPAGATSTPSVSPTGTGAYAATVTLDQAGRWRWRWTTTGPAGVDHGYVDVKADPPTRLEPLATIEDLELHFGRSLTADELARAPALLIQASAAVRGATRPRRNFVAVTGDTVIIRPIGTILTIPVKPVIAVTKVEGISGMEGIADFEVTGWRFNGVDEIEIAGYGWQTAIDYDLEPDIMDAWTPDTYRVTLDHGDPITPDDINGKCCQLVMRVLTAGSTTEGQTQMTVGQYSEQWQQSAGTMGLMPVMTRADKQDLIDWGYRQTASTIVTRT